MIKGLLAMAFIFVTAGLVQGQSSEPHLGPPTDVSFKAKVDGTTQWYMELLPIGFDKSKPHHLMIALHGHGSDRHQFATGAPEEAKAARDIAAKYDMIYICPDYRATASWMGPKAEADVLQIIKMMHKKYKVDKTFMTGGSMGASSALTFAALHPDLIDGVSSQNGTANHLEYENFQDAISASFGGTKQEIPLEYKKRSAEYWPEKFTMPVAITAGGQDTLVPPQSVLRLGGVLKKIGRTVLVIYREQGGHSTNYADTCESLEFVITNALKTD